MAAKNTKGVTVCVTKGSAIAATVIPTAIAKSTTSGDSRAEIKVTPTTSYKPGDVVKIPAGGTGFSVLDGKSFTIGSVSASGFTLNGTDWTVTPSGSLASNPTMDHYEENDMVCLCLSDLKFNAEKGSTVSVATFCDPSASIPSASTTAGTVDIGGFVDISTADYKEIVAAELDGVERIFRIMLPSNGEIVFPAIVSTLGWQVPIDGAVAWEAQLALGSRPRHLY
jgi:hypothetical protein